MNYIFVFFVLFSTLLGCDKIPLRTSVPLPLETVVSQLALTCNKDLIISDEFAKNILKDPLPPQSTPPLTLSSHLANLVEKRNLFVATSPHTLTISHFKTVSYPLDYIGTKRSATSNTDVSFSGTTTSNDILNRRNNASQIAQTATPNTVGTSIKSDDDFDFWGKLENDLNATINTPSDPFTAPSAIINKEAGIVTVTASPLQHKRVDSYLSMLSKRLSKQVFVDVHIYNITLDKSHTTGVDWSKIYSIVNSVSLQAGAQTAINTESTFNPTSTQETGRLNSGFISMSAKFDLSNLVKFLSTQGDVTTISNPKILTLDNQPAIISSGEHIYYLRQGMTSTISTSSSTTTSATSQIIESVFAGILLDITPQISDDGTIMMRINPSITSCKDIGCGSAKNDIGVRLMPPDMLKKQLSSVVRVKEGERIILGGLIHNATGETQTKVPLLGDIPLLGRLFKQTSTIKTTQELLIIITPMLTLPHPSPLKVQNETL